MTAYILRRLIILPILWLAVTFIIFLMLEPLDQYQRLQLYVQGDPEQLVPTNKLTREEIDLILDKYGLNDPFYKQYFDWLGGVFQGNLGWSRTARKPVLEALGERLPATIELTMYAIIPLILFGIWMGVMSAVNHNTFIDHMTRMIAISGYSLPTFVFAIMVLMLFYGQWDLLQPGRLSLWANQVVYSDVFSNYQGIITIDSIFNWRWDVWWDAF